MRAADAGTRRSVGDAGTAALRAGRLRWWHLADVADAEGEAFGRDAWSAGQWWEELAAEQRVSRVLVDAAGAVVAYGVVALAPPDAELLTLAVLPAGRGRGAGTRLLDDLLEQAAAAGAQLLHLEVRADNAPALRLYERRGARVVGRRAAYYDGGRVDAVVLLLELPPGRPRAPLPDASGSPGSSGGRS